ncbi:MAG TPA: DUF2341 domain-containing protein [Candidatus Thermoplasmatota archaeon]|nr:DUF2341 domain-containing protein [Candidatus Thermoplasmatota archaeon]
MIRKISLRILLVFIISSLMMSTTVSLANIRDSADQRSIQPITTSDLMQLQKTKESSPQRADDSWWNSQWQYRKEIMVNYTKIVTNQTNFPVLLSFVSDAELSVKAQPDGDDLVFTNANKGRLNHEIELFNCTTGQLIVWVNVTFLSSIQDTIIYLYYGNSICGNQENSQGTWGSHYRMVQHLSETTGIHNDSTMYGNDGLYYGSTQNSVGIIDGADQFVGNFGATGGDYVDCGNDSSLNITDAITVSAWIKPNDQTQWNHICSKGNGEWTVNPNRVYQLSIEINESIDFIINSNQTAGKAMTSQHVPIGSWSYVVGTYDRNAIRVYINGVECAVKSPFAPLIQSNLVHFRIAARVADALNVGPPAFTFDGVIDEVRICDSALSAAWIATEYNNQQSPMSFYSIGVEETLVSQPWDLTMHISTSMRSYDYVMFGEKTNASDGLDSYDVPKNPPSIPPFLYTMFSTNLTEPYHMLWYDYKHCPDTYKVWDLKVQWVPSDYTSPTNVTIAWNNSALNGSEYSSVTLENIETNETIDMLDMSSYTFNASALSLHPFKIICRALTRISNPSYGWNFISLPFNQSLEKTNFFVKYAGRLYDWVNATAGGLVINSLAGWNRTSQNYYLTTTLVPGEGYWMFFYHDCELWAQGVSTTESSNEISQLLPLWNTIGLPDDTLLPKEDLHVLYENILYNWTQATTNANPTGAPLILKFIYNWSRPIQNYVMCNFLLPGEGYWLYAYQQCVLCKDNG